MSERVVVLCSFLLHAIDPKSEGCSDLKALLRGEFSFRRKWLYGKGGICWWLFIEGNGILFVNMIYDQWQYYIIAYLISPYLSLVYIVVFVSEVAADDRVDLLLHEGTDVVEHCLFLLAHLFFIFYQHRVISNCNCNSYSHR